MVIVAIKVIDADDKIGRTQLRIVDELVDKSSVLVVELVELPQRLFAVVPMAIGKNHPRQLDVVINIKGLIYSHFMLMGYG